MIACIYFPTIMSGPVLRWFQTAEIDGRLVTTREVANAGRSEAVVLFDIPGISVADIDEARTEIHAAYYRRAPEVWRRRITHTRSPTWLSDEIFPVEKGEEEAA